jgi:hypothetical protein
MTIKEKAEKYASENVPVDFYYEEHKQMVIHAFLAGANAGIEESNERIEEMLEKMKK